MEYTAKDYIRFIDNNRFDKISNNALMVIAKEFKRIEDENVKLNLPIVNSKMEQLICTKGIDNCNKK